MLYIRYFIILDGQSIKKVSFRNFHFCSFSAYTAQKSKFSKLIFLIL